MKTPTDRIEAAVRARYSEAAGSRVEALCCSTVYDDRYLRVLPDEILERDYGCGDPSRHLAPGETVLDLGSGAGKICFIASQVVGPEGSVIGVDFNDDMLRLAESHRAAVGDRIGYHNVRFRKGRIIGVQGPLFFGVGDDFFIWPAEPLEQLQREHVAF